MAVGHLELLDEVRVLARLHCATTQWRPDPASRLDVGDEVIVVATRAGLARALERAGAEARPPMESEYSSY
jgi:K+/H+ antiporter YhaU regulatory subunit KhtT